MIGIVGGIGPFAGADLYKKIVEHTVTQFDQGHLPVLLASLPGEIADRTLFLSGLSEENPAVGLAKVIMLLENAGAKQIAIACNSAHAAPIFTPLLEMLKVQGSTAEIIHLIDITIEAIRAQDFDLQRIGVLVTSGAYKTKVYQNELEAAGFTPVILPFERHDALIQDAIFKIKISGDAVNEQVVCQLNTALQEMHAMGAQAVILGCTEIGMIEKMLDFRGMGVFNPNTIMARTLIMKHSPEKLLI